MIAFPQALHAVPQVLCALSHWAQEVPTHRKSQYTATSIMCPVTLGTGGPKTVPQVLRALHQAQEVPTQRLKRYVPHRVPNTTLQALCALHHAGHKKSQHNASSVVCLTGCPIQHYKHCVPYTMLGTGSPNTTPQVSCASQGAQYNATSIVCLTPC